MKKEQENQKSEYKTSTTDTYRLLKEITFFKVTNRAQKSFIQSIMLFIIVVVASIVLTILIAKRNEVTTLWGVISSILFVLCYVFIMFMYILRSLTKRAKKNSKEIDDLLWQHQQLKVVSEDKTSHNRLHRIEQLLISDNANDYKVAIFEADILLEEKLRQKGFIGHTMGDILKNITTDNLSSINVAWTAHKVRNNLAHRAQSIDRDTAMRTIGQYQFVLRELDAF